MSEDIEKRDREELEKSFREVLFSPSGKRVLFWMLAQCNVYNDAYAGIDAATNYELGRRSIGLMLIKQIEAIDPRLYPQLLLDIAEMKAMTAAAVSKDDDHENDNDLD